MSIYNFIHRTPDEMIARYPEPKVTSTLDAEKAPPIMPAPSRSQRAASAFGRKPVARMDPVQIRHRLDLDDAKLRRMDWTDERLAQIPDEESATIAFSLSRSLQMEFLSDRATFLSYWRGLHRRNPSPSMKGHAMPTMYTNEQLAQHITTQSDAERLWKGSAQLQDEFQSPTTLFYFARAVAEGRVKMFTR